jgi:hypothetical protein
MSELIKIAKEALKKARLEKEARRLKEETEEEESKFLEVGETNSTTTSGGF